MLGNGEWALVPQSRLGEIDVHGRGRGGGEERVAASAAPAACATGVTDGYPGGVNVAGRRKEKRVRCLCEAVVTVRERDMRRGNKLGEKSF